MFPRFPMVLHPKSPVAREPLVSSFRSHSQRRVTGFSQGYPTISQREASTSATVHDGETFVIGGLTEESRISNRSKLPVLGDIPLLGTLFTAEHTSSERRDLYIVVTPHVVAADAA